MGKVATPPLPPRGSPPPQSGGQNQKWPINGQGGYVTPAASGIPSASSGSESTVGLRGGSGSESEGTRALWSSLGMVPMDSEELTGEASGEPAPRDQTPQAIQKVRKRGQDTHTKECCRVHCQQRTHCPSALM